MDLMNMETQKFEDDSDLIASDTKKQLEETDKFEDSSASKFGESQRTFGESTMNLMNMETQKFDEDSSLITSDTKKQQEETEKFDDSSASKIGESQRIRRRFRFGRFTRAGETHGDGNPMFRW